MMCILIYLSKKMNVFYRLALWPVRLGFYNERRANGRLLSSIRQARHWTLHPRGSGCSDFHISEVMIRVKDFEVICVSRS
jgi:hypothetical protein